MIAFSRKLKFSFFAQHNRKKSVYSEQSEIKQIFPHKSSFKLNAFTIIMIIKYSIKQNKVSAKDQRS